MSAPDLRALSNEDLLTTYALALSQLEEQAYDARAHGDTLRATAEEVADARAEVLRRMTP